MGRRAVWSVEDQWKILLLIDCSSASILEKTTGFNGSLPVRIILGGWFSASFSPSSFWPLKVLKRFSFIQRCAWVISIPQFDAVLIAVNVLGGPPVSSHFFTMIKRNHMLRIITSGVQEAESWQRGLQVQTPSTLAKILAQVRKTNRLHHPGGSHPQKINLGYQEGTDNRLTDRSSAWSFRSKSAISLASGRVEASKHHRSLGSSGLFLGISHSILKNVCVDVSTSWFLQWIKQQNYQIVSNKVTDTLYYNKKHQGNKQPLKSRKQ